MQPMIIDRDETTILNHAGWRDDYFSLWRYRVEERTEEHLDWPGRPFSLHPARDRIHVTMVERSDDGAHRVTIRPIAEIETVLASATHQDNVWTFDGPRDLWNLAPPYVVVDGGKLLHIDPNDADLDPLVWYEQGYDLNYQGLGPAYPIPDSHLLLIAIQRDSRPVVYDPVMREVLGHIALAERRGNPTLYFREDAPELWADDYDTLLRLRVPTWEVLDAVEVQQAEGGMRKFIGSFWFPPDESFCVVARPFSGDAAIIDPESFAVVRTVSLPEQPIDAVTARGEMIARDWQTRRLLRARLDMS